MKVLPIVMCLGAFLLAPALTSAAKPAAKDATLPEHKFDASDPAIQALKKLKYKDVDIKATPIETKFMAVIALNELLGKHGHIASQRVKMLNSYIAKHKLATDYSAYTKKIDALEPIPFEDAAKLAIAYVQTPVGNADYKDRLKGTKEDVKMKVAMTLLKQCKKAWVTVRQDRLKVESMAQFLAEKEQFDEYIAWADKEAGNQKKAAADDRAKSLALIKDEEEKRRAIILQVQQEQKARSHEMRMKRMEYTYSLKEEQVKANAEIRKARYDRQGYNGWNGNGNDVYYRRRYRR